MSSDFNILIASNDESAVDAACPAREATPGAVAAALSFSGLSNLNEGLMRINNEQIDMCRATAKEIAVERSQLGDALYEEITRINNDLANLQRELFKKNVELGKLNALNALNKLFKSFSRTGVKSSGGESSAGLGPSIVRRIVEGHHGTVSVESVEGKGAAFKVRLPLVALSPQIVS